MRSFDIVILVGVLACLGHLTYPALYSVSKEFTKTLHFNDDGCVLVTHPDVKGCEDLTMFDDRFLVTGSDDRFSLWASDVGIDTPSGSLFFLDTQQPIDKITLQPLAITGFPEGVPFHPHGLSFAAGTKNRLLYVINHAYNKGGERVEVFELKKTEDGSKLTAEYKLSVRNEVFDRDCMGHLNDLVVVGPNEFYVTVYQPVPDSPEGRNHNDMLTNIRNKPELALFMKPSYVLYCSHDSAGASECKVAADGFAMANGINVDSEGDVWVVELLLKNVVVYEPLRDHTLVEKYRIDIPHATDNIEYDPATNSFYGGSLLFLFDHAKFEHSHGQLPSHGGVFKIDARTHEIEEVIQTTKLGGIATGVNANGKVLMGSWGASGVLACPTPQ